MPVNYFLLDSISSWEQMGTVTTQQLLQEVNEIPSSEYLQNIIITAEAPDTFAHFLLNWLS